MDEVASEVELMLRQAGWWPGRRASVEFWIDHFEGKGCTATDAAIDFLVEFGGLEFPYAGRGVDRAREPIDFDPILCGGDEDRFIDWGVEINRSLFPIGVLGAGLQCLGIDELSEIYLVEAHLLSFGRMPAAMENLLLGRMSISIDCGE